MFTSILIPKLHYVYLVGIGYTTDPQHIDIRQHLVTQIFTTCYWITWRHTSRHKFKNTTCD